jgi:hypothetical protein
VDDPRPCAVAFAKSKRQPLSIDLRDCSRVISVVSRVAQSSKDAPARVVVDGRARRAALTPRASAGVIVDARRHRRRRRRHVGVPRRPSGWIRRRCAAGSLAREATLPIGVVWHHWTALGSASSR